MADPLDMGWLPDAIVRAIFEFLRSILVSALNFMFNFGLKPLLTIEPSIMMSTQVTGAWDDVFRLSIALLPILIAGGLIAMPFSQDRETSLWNMVARVVAVIFFIAISQPLFGFLIEASNAVTNALAPPTFVLTFNADLGGSWGSTLGLGVEVIALLVAVPLMFIATIIASVLLVLRQFIVVTVAVGAPFFAVLWYANWGPMKSISNFASTWIRMGVYALLVGPIIALVMRVFNVIATGGISASGDVASFYVSAALVLIFPIILFVVIWKTIGWAGQPLGVDAAFTMTVAAAIAATGVGAVAVGAGAGSAAVSSASTSGSGGASGGASAGRSSGAGGGTSSGTAADPSAATGNSTVGGKMRSSISDALSTREPPAEDSVDPAPGALSVNKDAVHHKSMSVPGVRMARKTAGQTGAKVKKLGSKARRTGVSSARKIVGSESIDGHRKMISQQMDTAAEADANRNFLTEAYQSGEIDIAKAADRGILSGSERPAEGLSTVSLDPDGNVTYPTTEGGETRVNINDRAQDFGEQAQTLREDASKSARSVNRIRTAQVAAKTPARVALSGGRATKRVGNSGVQVGKASGVVFAGAMTQSPYASYQIGKRGGKHLIGPGASTQSDDPSDDTDIDWSARREGPEQAMDQRSANDAGDEPSETL